MSSREVAELTGKRHDHVLRDIRTMIDRLSTTPDLGWHCETDSYVDAKGEAREMYLMDKDTTLTLISGYDAVLRFRIIKRWQELELVATPTLPRNFAEALRLAADQQERIEQQQREIEASRPKVVFHDQVVVSETLLDFTELFSLLQRKTGQEFSRTTFIEFGRRHGFICQQNPHSGITKNRLVPRKDYVGTWFVSEMRGDGGTEWRVRPMAVAGIVALIEIERNRHPFTWNYEQALSA